jgi:hypothetical protein
MDLLKAILKEHSTSQKEKIVNWIGGSQQRFDELFHIFMSGEYRVVQRSAWPLSYCAVQHPELIQKHFTDLVRQLTNNSQHQAVKRNILRLLAQVTIPESFHGDVMDLCFQYISTPEEPAAVKAFSLHILQNFALQYPDIAGEVKVIIQDEWDNESPAFRSRAKKFLESVDKKRRS